MSSQYYQNNVICNQKEIADFRNKMSVEMSKKSKLGKEIAAITASLPRLTNMSTYKTKMSQLTRKQEELSKTEKKISQFEDKIAKKNKELQRHQKSLDSAMEREDKQKIAKEKQQQRETLNGLRQINQEL